MTTNAGLDIFHVTEKDAGIYTVIVQIFYPDGDPVFGNNSVTVQIIDELPKEYTELHVTQEEVAEYNDTTKQVHVVLACGKFVFSTKPHFDVEWLTPSGSVVPSTSYSDGQFRLQLPNPVLGGSYTCRVPASAAAASPCVPGTSQHRAEASVSVDRVEARLALLEGQHRQLEKERLARQTQFQEYINGQTRSISFRVRINGGFGVSHSGTPITGFNQIQMSEGLVYERYSWKFITPYAGVYFFALTTVSDGNVNRANADVMVDDVIACRIRSAMDGDFGSCEATVHLARGQKVWLRSLDDHGSYGNGMYPTFAFCGFLVSKDV
ncbi:hypothetical protein V1264_017073 [Littorina saxatilis]|uniref:Uncharacterized protein n=2 Tax=Littorina saxatilis TaxID=31220 RepID=A0AAN9BHX4_9CAEN